MLDNEVRRLERIAQADRTVENYARYWTAQLRAGIRSNPQNYVVEKPGAQIRDSFRDGSMTVAYTITPGSKCSVTDPVEVDHVIWTDEASEAWTYHYFWTLLLAKDGRFVAVTSGSSGTCSSCGGDIYEVTVADTLMDAIMIGLSDQARELLLNSLPRPAVHVAEDRD